MPRKLTVISSLVLLLAVFVVGGSTCPTMTPDPGNGGGTDPTAGTGPTLVLTGVDVHVQGRVACGDGIMAYTAINADRTPFGPDYIKEGDTAGRGIPGAADYDADSFAVTGKYIAMVKPADFSVAVFNTETLAKTEFPSTDIRLKNIPIGNYVAGHMQADGGYIATISKPSDVTDGFSIKVVDVTGATPTVHSFTNNPANDTIILASQVMVDAETNKVVALRRDVFYVYDIMNPTTAPVEFDLSGMGGVDDGPQYAFDNGVIIYHDDTSDRKVYTLDCTSASNTPTALNGEGSTGANARFAIRDGSYAYYFAGPASQGNACASGTLPNTTPVVGSGDTIASNSTNLGRFSYGDTLAIGFLNGTLTWFIAAQDNIGVNDPIQYSTDGAAWNLVPDPADPTNNFSAGDVATNEAGNCLVFKYEVNDEQKLGYSRITTSN